MEDILIKACGVTTVPGKFVTGIGRSTINLLEAISEIDNLPISIRYYTTGLRASNIDRSGIKLKHSELFVPDKIIHATQLDVLLRKYILKPKLFHITHNYDDIYIGENYLLTIHDVWAYLNIANENVRKKWERAAKNATAIVTCSNYSKNVISDVFKIPNDRIFSIPWGVSKIFRLKSDNEVKKDLADLNIKYPYFLSVSCNHPRKNISTLIKAYIKFNNKHRQHKLVLVWSNPFEEVLNLCRKEVESGDIVFLKYVPDEKLVSLYNGATASFFPTRYEGFGFPILESMACGTPIVTCQNTSLPEVGGNVALYTGEDDINQMVAYMEQFDNKEFDFNTYRTMAIQHAKEFSWHNTAKKYIELYKSLI